MKTISIKKIFKSIWGQLAVVIFLISLIFALFSSSIRSILSPLWDKETSEIARNWGLLIAGVIGFPLAFWRTKIADLQLKNNHKQLENTNRQLKLTEDGQNTDRFQKGAAMLESDKETVRNAGVLVLKNLGERDLAGHYSMVTELLCAFMQDRTRQQWKDLGLEDKEVTEVNEQTIIQPDCQTAITAISHLHGLKVEAIAKASEGEKIPVLFLQGVNLIKADLNEANLQRANLSRANLQGADLFNAKLQGAHLSNAKLQGARLQIADLQGARLQIADLQGAYLDYANLQEAHLNDANLQRARLNDANLQEANLRDAKLQGAHLYKTNLQGADLNDANLQEAHLHKANLQGARLNRANLQNAFLNHADLNNANLQGVTITVKQLTTARNVDQEWIDHFTELEASKAREDGEKNGA